MKSLSTSIAIILLLALSPASSQEFSSLATIYNFNIGDNFQIKKFNCCNEIFFELEEMRVLNKYTREGSIHYVRNINCYKFANTEIPFIADTLEYNHIDTLIIVNPDSVIFKPGDEIIVDSSIYNGRKICIKYSTFMGKPKIEEYVDGCGLALKTWIILPDSGCWNSDSLIYYKKGDEIWGKTILASDEDLTHENEILIFPNPVSDNLYIRFPM